MSAIQVLLSFKAHQSNTSKRQPPNTSARFLSVPGRLRGQAPRAAPAHGDAEGQLRPHPEGTASRMLVYGTHSTQLSSSTFQTQSRSRTCCYMSADSECSQYKLQFEATMLHSSAVNTNLLCKLNTQIKN